MDSTDIVDMVRQGLGLLKDPRIKHVSFDGDNHSNEIIITTEDGEDGKQDWRISSGKIEELDPEEEDEE